MNRREAIRNTSLFLGAVSMGVMTSQLASCKVDPSTVWEPEFLTLKEGGLLSEIAETILPKTDTPGAKDAMVARYLDTYAKRFLEPEEQTAFKKGLLLFDSTAMSLFDKDFVSLDNVKRGEVLQAMIDDPTKGDASPSQVFFDMRSAVNEAFFTSEIVATQILDYNPIPGDYLGDIPISDTKGLVYSG